MDHGSTIASDLDQATNVEDSADAQRDASSEMTPSAPNLRALAILKEVHERRIDRLSSPSGRSQDYLREDYLREARSGGMYGVSK
jgi:hypothetical protein